MLGHGIHRQFRPALYGRRWQFTQRVYRQKPAAMFDVAKVPMRITCTGTISPCLCAMTDIAMRLPRLIANDVKQIAERRFHRRPPRHDFVVPARRALRRCFDIAVAWLRRLWKTERNSDARCMHRTGSHNNTVLTCMLTVMIANRRCSEQLWDGGATSGHKIFIIDRLALLC